MTPKKCIDKTMLKIVKSLKLPSYIKDYITYSVEQDGLVICYCVVIDNTAISKIPIQQFYTSTADKIKRTIKYDLENYISNVYKKRILL